jgi:hypothetical protein
MKPLRVLLTSAFALSLIVGCDTGGDVKEGLPENAAEANPQPTDLQDMMKNQGSNMPQKGKKPAAPAAAPAK